MSDKKPFLAPTKTVKTKRPSTVSIPASSRTKLTASTKDKVISKPTKQKTYLPPNDADTTIASIARQDGSMPDFDSEYRQIAYGKFLRAMLEECLVDEKIEREETQLDLQMAHLADRFQKTVELLDKTNRRVKDISFVVQQKWLLDMKKKDSTQFYTTTDNSNVNELLQKLNATEEASLDRLELKNIDFGYSKESGHKQLLDAVNDAVEGLSEIKKHSNLDSSKFNEYERSQKNIEDIEKDKFDLETLRSNFEARFPRFSERLLKEASDKIAKMMEEDNED